MGTAAQRIEFRIPISPTEGFFSQIRLFNFSLRRLGGLYANACLRVVVGDHCDLDDVRRHNSWSEAHNIVWDRVPDALFAEAGIWGTANWRLNLPSEGADAIFLVDADTVMLRDVDPVIDDLLVSAPVLRGHMAHYPPPLSHDGEFDPSGDFWLEMLRAYGAQYVGPRHRYSMDPGGRFPPPPPYFNLGFVALNSLALQAIGQDIHWTESWLKHRTNSNMRCQIALTLIAARRQMDIDCLPAAYNAANDVDHLSANDLPVSDIRVLHYLREVEFQRSNFLLAGEIDAFLHKSLDNPANRCLQDLVREYRAEL